MLGELGLPDSKRGMMSHAVELSEYAFRQAEFAGNLRREHAVKNNFPEPYGTPPSDLLENDINSCCAEMAVAKFYNLHWEAVVDNPSKDLMGDVGSVLEVRSTWRRSGRLILHRRDRDDFPFILAIGKGPHWILAGWMWGEEGKKQKYWDGGMPRPCYAVPQQDLKNCRLSGKVWPTRL